MELTRTEEGRRKRTLPFNQGSPPKQGMDEKCYKYHLRKPPDESYPTRNANCLDAETYLRNSRVFRHIPHISINLQCSLAIWMWDETASRYSDGEQSAGNVNQGKNSSWEVNLTVENARVQFWEEYFRRSAITVSKAKWSSVKPTTHYLALGNFNWKLLVNSKPYWSPV